MPHEVEEEMVARRLGDAQVELEVGIGRVAAAGRRAADRLEQRVHAREVLAAAALRRQRRGFGLQADAQFEQREHLGERRLVDALDRELDRAGLTRCARTCRCLAAC
jgi:hypothetical protein